VHNIHTLLSKPSLLATTFSHHLRIQSQQLELKFEMSSNAPNCTSNNSPCKCNQHGQASVKLVTTYKLFKCLGKKKCNTISGNLPKQEKPIKIS